MSRPNNMEEQIKENTFSIILPVAERKNLVQKAIKSVQNQPYQKWELIVVNDGSTDGTKEAIDEIAKTEPRMKVIHHPMRIQRVISRNDGMKAATNDWICWLDSDDEYVRTYLDSINWAINEYPEYKIFHFGTLVCKLRYYTVRETPNIKEEGEGMERFSSGKIGAGSFIFKRELLDEVGYLPEARRGTPYAFADIAKEESPEIMEWYGPKYMEGGKELGNPWGEDWYMFYKLTRKHKSKGLPFILYLNYIRRSGFIHQDDDLRRLAR